MPLSRAFKRKVRRALLLAAAALVLIQFVRLPRNLAASGEPMPLPERYQTTPDIRRILTASCFDCHSDHTRYPWYANVQPVGWVINAHVRGGRRHLDFTRFPDYTLRRGAEKLDQIADSVANGRMPHASYLRYHDEARLSPEEIRLVVDWAMNTADKLREENRASR